MTIPDIRFAIPAWTKNAACGKAPDPEAFFPEPTQSIGAALRYCRRCPVREQCLDDAMEQEGSRGPSTRYGIRGGLTPTERARLAKERTEEPEHRRAA